MSNMSYCRFQNTSRDFRDCLENLRTLRANGGLGYNDMEELAARRALIHDAALLLQEIGAEDIYDHREIDTAVDALDAGDGMDADDLESEAAA
jgi:hypothetical protein